MLTDQLAVTGPTGLQQAAAQGASAGPSTPPRTAVSGAGAASGQAGLASPASPADSAALKKSVAALNASAQPHFGSIEFSVDENSGKTLLKVVDKETNTVLLQIPSKVALALSQDSATRQGLLIKDTA